MCIEDIRLGRETIMYRNRLTVPGNGSIQILDYAPDRVGIYIPSSDNNQNIGVDTEDLNSVVEGTIALYVNDVKLDIRHHGQMVTSQWFAMNSGVADYDMTVWEVRLRRQ